MALALLVGTATIGSGVVAAFFVRNRIGGFLDHARNRVGRVFDETGNHVGGFLDETGNRVGRVLDRTEDAVGIARELKEFFVEKIWPIIRPSLRTLSIILLMIAILYCDTILKAKPRANFEMVLAGVIFYGLLTCVLYLALKILLDNLLGVTVNTRCLLDAVIMTLVVAVILTLVVILPSWLLLGDYLIQAYEYIKPSVMDLVECLFYRK